MWLSYMWAQIIMWQHAIANYCCMWEQLMYCHAKTMRYHDNHVTWCNLCTQKALNVYGTRPFPPLGMGSGKRLSFCRYDLPRPSVWDAFLVTRLTLDDRITSHPKHTELTVLSNLLKCSDKFGYGLPFFLNSHVEFDDYAFLRATSKSWEWAWVYVWG